MSKMNNELLTMVAVAQLSCAPGLFSPGAVLSTGPWIEQAVSLMHAGSSSSKPKPEQFLLHHL